MKLKDASLLFGSLLRDWRFIRFATLTRPFIGAEELSLSIAPTEVLLSDAFFRRAQECYQRSLKLGSRPEGTIWADLERKNKAFFQALESDDLSSLRLVADNLFAGSTIEGMAHVQAFIQGKKTIYPKRYFSYRVKDSILSLSEALGLSSPPSNQQTPLRAYIDYLNQDLAPLIEEIEAALGHSLSAPFVGHPPVAQIGKCFYNPDFIRHAYIPHRIHQLGLASDAQILEIGGGYGCVARYGALRGFKHWTIIDLPYVNAIQMIWLGATMGEAAVSGIGEDRATIHLLPSNAKENIREQSFDLVLNMDSLPEMPADESNDYLSIVENCADLFLSVNQEARKVHGRSGAQNSVHDMMREKEMELAHRGTYWMEQGYTEELYRRRP